MVEGGSPVKGVGVGQGGVTVPAQVGLGANVPVGVGTWLGGGVGVGVSVGWSVGVWVGVGVGGLADVSVGGLEIDHHPVKLRFTLTPRWGAVVDRVLDQNGVQGTVR